MLRVFAILVVVLGHSMIVYSSNWNTFELQIGSTFFDTLKKYIDIFQMPLFISISGYLYYFNRVELGKYKNKVNFIKNKLVRLLIPYFSVAIIYVIPIRLIIDYEGYQVKSYVELIIRNVFLGEDIGHLWFLPVLFTIFILFYLFERFISKIPFFLGILFFIGISVISGFFPTIFFIQKSLNYLLYFYIGYEIRKLVQEKKSIGNTKLMIAFFILQFLGIGFSIIIRNQDFIIFNGMALLFNKVSSLSSVLFYYILFNKISIKNSLLSENKVIKYLNKESFQIYLFHSPLVYIVLYFIQDYSINPFIVVTGIFIICIFGSILLSKLSEHLGILSLFIGKKKKLGKATSNIYKVN